MGGKGKSTGDKTTAKKKEGSLLEDDKTTTAKPEKAAANDAKTTTAKPEKANTCEVRTKGTCSWSSCDKSRGEVYCDEKGLNTCVCKPGYCATEDGEKCFKI